MFSPHIINIPLLHFHDVGRPQDISPQALYGYYESYGINFFTLDRILLDPFLIILDIFATFNTPDEPRSEVL
jgi:hypothetical protein